MFNTTTIGSHAIGKNTVHTNFLLRTAETVAKKKQLEKYLIRPKTNKEYFNCIKKSYYARDCYTQSLNIKKSKKSLEETKYTWLKKNETQTVATELITDYNNLDVELYSIRQAFIICIRDEKLLDIWYLDSCALKYICNSLNKFADLQVKTYKFVMARRNIISLDQVEIIISLLKMGSKFTLSYIFYTPRWDSNLIFLGQL